MQSATAGAGSAVFQSAKTVLVRPAGPRDSGRGSHRWGCHPAGQPDRPAPVPPFRPRALRKCPGALSREGSLGVW